MAWISLIAALASFTKSLSEPITSEESNSDIESISESESESEKESDSAYLLTFGQTLLHRHLHGIFAFIGQLPEMAM